jgi:hypothetical protein
MCAVCKFYSCQYYARTRKPATAVWEFVVVHILLQTFACCKGGTNKATCACRFYFYVNNIIISTIIRIHWVHRYFLKRKTIFGISSNLQMDANSDTCMMLVLSIYTCRTLQYETTTTVAAREFVVHFL